jgi:pimeloyl-ACP methyl ester carboxylesterase
MKLAVRTYLPESEPTRDIVLIHGTGARAEMWRNQIPLLLERGYRCIVPDLRGHGETAEPEENADIQAHLNDIEDTLADIGLKGPTPFAGHSLGAIISLGLAERRPELFEQILAISMPGRVPQITQTAFKLFMGWPYRTIKDSGIHKNLAWRERVLMETNEFTLGQIVSNFGDMDYITNVPKVACPVHYGVGRLDPVALYTHVEQIQKATPNSTLKIFEWAGHNCMDSQPQAFNKWFLEKLEGARTSSRS